MQNQENSGDTFYADAAKNFADCARKIIESGQLEPVVPLPADWVQRVHQQAEQLTPEEKAQIKAKFEEAVDHFIDLAPQIIPNINITRADS